MPLIADRVLLPDIIAPGLDVIFVGAAPSYYAAETGHYYAGPRNRFWQLIHQAGFTQHQLHETEDWKVLEYGIGLTAIFRNVASSNNASLPDPTEEHRGALRKILLEYAPGVICFNGKDVFRMFNGHGDCRWGLQKDKLGRSRQFVVHSTSGRADRWGADRLFLFKELNALVTSMG
jgi:TDG/mug DNA glycosylase family protein